MLLLLGGLGGSSLEQFGRKVFEKSAIFGYFLEFRKFSRNWLQNPSKPWKQYQRPCDSFPTLQRARIYHLEAIWDSFCGDFPINCLFLAILRSIRKFLRILAQPSQRHQRACKSFPTSQRTHSYLLWPIWCSSDEDLGEFLQILAIFGSFSRWPKIIPRFYQNPLSDMEGLQTACLHCKDSEIFFWVQSEHFWRSFSEKFLKVPWIRNFPKGAKNRLQILAESSQHPRKACKSCPAAVQQTCSDPLVWLFWQLKIFRQFWWKIGSNF